MTAEPVPAPCPSCGDPVPDDTCWIFHGKIYCSEACCRKAAT